MDRNLTKAICWLNAALAMPYLASAMKMIYMGYTNPVFQEYTGEPSNVSFAFILFYSFFVYSLVGLRQWSQWLILVDAIAGYLLVLTFPIAGAYVLSAHPGQYVYRAAFDSSGVGQAVMGGILFSGKSAINTLNVLYFFGAPLFRYADKRPLAHALWLLPSIILIGGPAFVAYIGAEFYQKHFSPLAQSIAEGEFAKVTCAQVRENDGRKIAYPLDGHEVRISYNFDYTGVSVHAKDGKMGSTGGPKYFCRPAYKGPRTQ